MVGRRSVSLGSDDEAFAGNARWAEAGGLALASAVGLRAMRGGRLWGMGWGPWRLLRTRSNNISALVGDGAWLLQTPGMVRASGRRSAPSRRHAGFAAWVHRGGGAVCMAAVSGVFVRRALSASCQQSAAEQAGPARNFECAGVMTG